MSYTKLDERDIIPDHPLSLLGTLGGGLGYQDNINGHNNINNNNDGVVSHFASSSSSRQGGTATIITPTASSSLSFEEQNTRRASLSEPLTKGMNGTPKNRIETTANNNNNNNNNNNDSNLRIYDNPADPYYVFRDDLYKQLQLVDEVLAEYLRVIFETDSAANSYEVKDIKKQLKRHLKIVESTLNDVNLMVSAIEKDRMKFHHITDRELYDRTSLVVTSRERIQKTKYEMNSDAVKAKIVADERAKAIRRTATTTAMGNNNNTSSVILNNNNNNNNSAYDVNGITNNYDQRHDDHDNMNNHNSHHARTSLLMQHQDETLDELGAAVTRVGQMAESIHDEIGQQNKMLNEMDEDLTNVEEELGLVMGKLAKLLKTKDSWQLGTILCLIGTVFVLFLLVLYT